MLFYAGKLPFFSYKIGSVFRDAVHDSAQAGPVRIRDENLAEIGPGHHGDEVGDAKPVEYGEEVGCNSKHGEKQERFCVENGS